MPRSTSTERVRRHRAERTALKILADNDEARLGMRDQQRRKGKGIPIEGAGAYRRQAKKRYSRMIRKHGRDWLTPQHRPMVLHCADLLSRRDTFQKAVDLALEDGDYHAFKQVDSRIGPLSSEITRSLTKLGFTPEATARLVADDGWQDDEFG